MSHRRPKVGRRLSGQPGQLGQPVPDRGPEDGRLRDRRRPGRRPRRALPAGRQRRQHHGVLAGVRRVRRRPPADAGLPGGGGRAGVVVGSYVRVLRDERDFRRVYLATLVSLGGDWFAVVPLLTLLPKLTGSGLYGGLTLAADTATFALFAPYAGTVSDRVD